MLLDDVKEIIAELLSVSADKLTADTLLTEDLKADSIDKAELVTALEDKFNIIIDYDEALKVKSIGDIVTAIEKLV